MAKLQTEQDSHAAGPGSTTGDPGQSRAPQQPKHSDAQRDDRREAAAPAVPVVPPEAE